MVVAEGSLPPVKIVSWCVNSELLDKKNKHQICNWEVSSRVLPWSFHLPTPGSLDLKTRTDVAETVQLQELARSTHRNYRHSPFWTEGPKGLCFSLTLLLRTLRVHCGGKHANVFLSQENSIWWFTFSNSYILFQLCEFLHSVLIFSLCFSQSGSLCPVMDWYIFTQQDLTGLLGG